MAIISWSTIKFLLLFLGPILLPRALAFYRSLRNQARVQSLPIRPLPPKVLRALVMLATVAFGLIVQALPPFSPENVFLRTQSRLQIPTDVLFTRLSSLRPNNSLTDMDSALRAKFVNLESRLLYLQFGPDVLANCPFCNVEEPRFYFYYAVPAILMPYVTNLIVVSIATSGMLTGREASNWRTYSVLGLGALVATDLWLLNSYNIQPNARVARLAELDLFYWNMRVFRRLALAVFDLSLAAVLYLSSTNRMFVVVPTPAERIDNVTRQLLAIKSKMNAVGIVKNTSIRDEELRGRVQAYWQHEGRLMREVMEEKEVIDGVNDALQNRINIQSITADAETYSLNVLPPPKEGTPVTTVG